MIPSDLGFARLMTFVWRHRRVLLPLYLLVPLLRAVPTSTQDNVLLGSVTSSW